MALVNVVKKVNKKAQSLGIAEQVVAGCTTNPTGTMKRSVAGSVGGLVGVAAAGGFSSDPSDDRPGLAAGFPKGRHFLVLTDSRLLVTSVSVLSGAPKEIVAEWPRTDIAEITVETGRLASPLTISFTDGSAVEVEGAKGTNPESLPEAFHATQA